MGDDEIKNSQNNEINKDRISNLPLNVLDKILVKMPLKEAVKTCILSKKWRCSWACISRISFKFDRTDNNSILHRAESLVYRYLLYHKNAIESFKIYRKIDDISHDLKVWIHILSRKSLKKLIIQNFPNVQPRRYSYYPRGFHPYLDLSASLFSLKQLEHLELSGCEVKVPGSFRGFSSLTHLYLSDVILYGEGDLTISGENLEYVELVSRAETIKFSDSRKLENVNFTLYESRTPKYRNKVGEFFSCLDGMTVLHSCSLPIKSFKVLVFADEEKELPLKHADPTSIYLTGPVPLDMNDTGAVTFFLSVLEGFSNLKKFCFSVRCSDKYEFLAKLSQLNMSKLEAVSVDYYDPNLSALEEFLHLIAGKSPLLETLEITKCISRKEEIKEEFGRCLLRRIRGKFQRLRDVSPSVKFIYKEKYFD